MFLIRVLSILVVAVAVAVGAQPSAPTSFVATVPPDCAGVSLAWVPVEANPAVQGYKVYRGDVLIATLVGKTTTNYLDTNVAPVGYSYYVKAYNKNGDSPPSVTASVSPCADTTPPPSPANLTAAAINSTQVSLSWSASIDSGPAYQIKSGVKEYRVYRNGTLVSSVTTTSVTDTGLAPATTYTYHVTAVDNAGNQSAASPVATVTTPAGRPDPPTDLTDLAVNCRNVTLAWAPPTYTGGAPLSSYKVYRNGVCVFTNFNITDTFWSDATVPAATNLVYTVSAVNSAGLESEQSLPLDLTTPPCIEMAVSGGVVIARWKSVKNPSGEAFPVEVAPSLDSTDWIVVGDTSTNGEFRFDSVIQKKLAGGPMHAGFVKIDGSASLVITSPTNGQAFTSSNITVTGTASAPGSGVARVEVRVNGGTWQTATGTTNWSRAVTLTSGTCLIEARSLRQGNNKVLATASVTVTYTPPSSCTYALSPTSWSAPAGGGSANISVATTSGCLWTVNNPCTSWLAVSPSSGTGSGTVTITATPNTSGSTRSCTVTIAGQSLTVTQPACNYAIAPTSWSAPAGGSSLNVTLTATGGCPWTVDNPCAGWLAVSPASGTGSGTVTITATPNSTGSTRSCTVTIAGQSLTVTQPACSYAIAPTSWSAPAGGGSLNATVTATGGCPWTVNNPCGSWVAVAPSSGTGSGTVTITASPNTTGSARSCVVTIAGQSLTVIQAGCGCAITPTSASFNATGGSGTVTVSACDYVATSSAAWLSIVSGSTGSGGGAIVYTVAPNASSSQRTAVLTITNLYCSTNFVVVQSGDADPPTVVITDPTTSPTYVTTNGTVNLGGTATDNVGVIQVTWTNNRGGSGVATGTTSWGIAGIALQKGTNVITVTATDAAGNRGSDTINAVFDVPELPPTNSPPGTVLWASALSTTASDYARAVAVDNAGNAVIAGDLAGTFFVAKYSPTGVPLWTNTYGGGYGKGVAADAAGNIYAVASEAPNTGYPYPVRPIVKLAPDGTVQWAKLNTNTVVGAILPAGVAVDGNGAVLVVGKFFGTVDLGDGPISSVSSRDFFLVKYDPTGRVIWRKTVVPTTSITPAAVGADSNNNVYVVGTLNDTADFGGGIRDGRYGSPFMVKYNSAGAHIWSVTIATNFSGTTAVALGVAKDGNLTIAGTYINSTDIGGGLFTTPMPPYGYYIANFSGSGTTGPVYIWSRNLVASTGAAVPFGLARDASGNIALTGGLSGSFDFGSGQLTSAGQPDIFVAKYSPAGQCVWSRRFGKDQIDRGQGVAFDTNGDVVVTGYYAYDPDFGFGPLPWDSIGAVVFKLAR